MKKFILIYLGSIRLTNAHSSLASNISTQSQSLHSLLFPLTSPFSPLTSSDPDLLDDLVPLLTTLPTLLPRPTLSALESLSELQTLTTDLVTNLSYLSDTVHITAQSTSLASRRLKATRDLVANIREQYDSAEMGTHWLEKGRWNERLEKRECADVCQDVVGGFEEVCNGWRERLVAMKA
jgi:hypothetical protein